MRNCICPQCDGHKVINVMIHDEHGKVYTEQLPCVTCDGHGKVSAPAMRAYYAMQAAWCRCDDVGDNIQFYDDGQHPQCHKHHYRHEPGCGGIVQIG